MELTDKNYETIIKNNEKPVFIDFYSPTCGPCQMLTKLIDERLEAYGEENGIKVVKCDVSHNPKLAEAGTFCAFYHSYHARRKAQVPRAWVEA